MKIFVSFLVVAISVGSLYAQEADSLNSSSIDQYNAGTNELAPVQDSVPSHNILEPDELSKISEYRSEKVSIRKFDHEKWKKVIGKTSYGQKEPEKKEREEKNTTPSIPWGGEVLKVIFYVLVFGIIALIIYLVARNSSSLDYKLKRNKLQGEDLAKPIENIEALDVDSLLRETLAAGNLKLAVRLYYLGLLKKLNEVGSIVWKRDKTNHDYLAELFSQNYFFEEIKILTLAYEEVWYGDHTITRERFDQLSLNFEAIDQKINMPPQP